MNRTRRFLVTVVAALTVFTGTEVATTGVAQALTYAPGCYQSFTAGSMIIPYNNTVVVDRMMIRFRVQRTERGYFTVSGVADTSYLLHLDVRSNTNPGEWTGTWSKNYSQRVRLGKITNSGQSDLFYWNATCVYA
jgi:hypothetical protein